MFNIVLNIAGSLMHLYVAARLYRIDAIRSRIRPRGWALGALLLWLVYLGGVHLGDEALDWRWWPGQFAMTWLGILFLMSSCLLLADLATGFGFWWRPHKRKLTAGAALAGILVSAFAIYQGVRTPLVVEHEVVLRGLPPALDGTVLVALSDIHLGAQRRADWMEKVVARINEVNPAAVLLLGDQVESDPPSDPHLAGVLRAIRAPRGVWAVTGNHEYYGNAAATIAEFSDGGVHWLRDQRVELLPGLTLAGIDDIGSRLRSGGTVLSGLERLYPAPAQGATILMAHIPAAPVIERAAARGIGLMLSGHTHGGQIWPFNYLVAQRFPYVDGAHSAGDLQVIVTRGAGGWGPRMRLWKPGEMLKLTLRAPR
ncbi:metallophosphoesterase [Massilia sp. ST3]|uniref:metallophosphoesterase n=1 Tax=Massilia sp. ST3 TaxID=2824903 RepID=UPI001B819BBC|nr:metallophosphoesterase [Massilia sp. ST3]MBQ5947720.1 metallophosphoesterase [Massilia sp. ST3]